MLYDGILHHFIIGAQKCGTTSLAHWLSQHPDICFSSDKEQRFWLMYYHKGLGWHRYTSFKHYDNEHITMEGKPLNFHVHFAAQRMYECFPNAKAIVIVRNPIERAYSAWNHFHRMRPGREPKQFSESIDENLKHVRKDLFVSEGEYMMQADPMGGCYETTYVEPGFYYHHIKRYMHRRVQNKILLLNFTELADPQKVMRKCCDFLDVSSLTKFRSDILRKSSNRLTAGAIKEQHPYTYELLRKCYLHDAISLSEEFQFDFATEWGLW
jgi:hypothetical protein